MVCRSDRDSRMFGRVLSFLGSYRRISTGNVYVEATRVSIVGLRIKRLVLDFSLLTSRHLERTWAVTLTGDPGHQGAVLECTHKNS